MKKLTSGILAAALLLGLAGCGGQAASGAGSASGATGSLPGDNTPVSVPAPPPGEEWAAGTQEGTPGEAIPPPTGMMEPYTGGEEYDGSPESPFLHTAEEPLSTFSADVDTASYSNMRRYLRGGNLPPNVRIEELVNYFDYDYPRPGLLSKHPFAVTAEVAPCPWNENNLLAMIGVQGMELENSGDIANNIVFLLDVSGSMSDENKLPLLKQSFAMLVETLGENDVISIVTYAGSDTVVADSVRGHQHEALLDYLNGLYAGGSTAGAQGLRTAYRLAEKNFIEGGNNRILLATDGDFNVGQSSVDELHELIREERDKGIYISVLGFGMGNLKDNRMETIADNGNGNYAYIDTIAEAKKVLVDEFDSTMFTIANDVKFQVAFNPEVVAEYRLIGYNNRTLANEDFEDDTKDAGDVGAGHSVTALYELVPAAGAPAGDFMNVQLRYKRPGETESRLAEHVVAANAFALRPSEDFRFASAVAELGLLLTESAYKGASNTGSLIQRAEESLGKDPYGLRAEFLDLAQRYNTLCD